MNIQFKDWYTVSLLQNDKRGDIYRIEKETKDGTLVSDLRIFTIPSENLNQAVQFFDYLIAQRDNKYLIKCYEYIIENYNNGICKILLRTEPINTSSLDSSALKDYTDRKNLFMKNVGQTLASEMSESGIQGYPGYTINEDLSSCLLVSSRGDHKLGLNYWMGYEEAMEDSDIVSEQNKEEDSKALKESEPSEQNLLSEPAHQSESETGSENEAGREADKANAKEEAINASYYRGGGSFFLNGKIIFLGVFLLLLGFAYVTLGGKKVVIPAGEGMEVRELVSEIRNLGLVPVEGLAEYNDDIEKGLVSSVENAGDKVQKGSKVYYHLSKGIQMTMISVIGMKQDDAKKSLEDMGLTVVLTNSYSDSVKKGLVIDQSAAEGEFVDETSSITLTISLGPDNGAEESTSASGSSDNNSVKADTSTVFRTSNQSAESETVIVPSLLDMTEDEGKQALTAAGLKVGEVYYDYSDTVNKGDIIRKSETTGDEVKRGTIVDITVSLGEED